MTGIGPPPIQNSLNNLSGNISSINGQVSNISSQLSNLTFDNINGILSVSKGGTGANNNHKAVWNLFREGNHPTDLNAVNAYGYYKIEPSQANLPASIWGIMLVLVDDAYEIGASSGSVWQIVFQSASTNSWIRCRTNSTSWSNWVSFT